MGRTTRGCVVAHVGARLAVDGAGWEAARVRAMGGFYELCR